MRFADQIRAMYAAGARIFVEIGPRNALTGLIRQILADEPHLALALDQPARPGCRTCLKLSAGSRSRVLS
ncbi:MAG: hypothetical protein HC822_10120 [Oscillochloris sp.]|nr:hypothetical protein [Oscillochloris sp.]